jgi:Uma2 family endonuclease
MESKKPEVVNEPDIEYGRYSYADYLTWEMDEMVELIKGKIFKRDIAAPALNHQRISMRLSVQFFNCLKGKTCQVFHAPFDVRLPVKSRKNQDIDTVVQPDICVVCDPDNLDAAGCIGAPDLVVEILSPGNNKRELKDKFEVYEEAGVKEYWVIHPNEQTLLIFSLVEGRYQASRLFTSGDHVTSACLPGFALNLEDIFEE